MRMVGAAAAVCFLVYECMLAPALSAQSYYNLIVDVMAPDGKIAAHTTLKCPVYEACRNVIPIAIGGQLRKMYVMARMEDPHRIYLTLSGLAERLGEEPFDSWSAVKAFEPGNEWTVDLSRKFSATHFGKSSGEKGGDAARVLARVRFRLES